MEAPMPPEGENLPPKPWWQSRTIIGLAVSAAAVVARLAGYEIDPADPALTDTAFAVVNAIGLAIAAWGRIKAKRPIALAILAALVLTGCNGTATLYAERGGIRASLSTDGQIARGALSYRDGKNVIGLETSRPVRQSGGLGL